MFGEKCRYVSCFFKAFKLCHYSQLFSSKIIIPLSHCSMKGCLKGRQRSNPIIVVFNRNGWIKNLQQFIQMVCIWEALELISTSVWYTEAPYTLASYVKISVQITPQNFTTHIPRHYFFTRLYALTTEYIPIKVRYNSKYLFTCLEIPKIVPFVWHAFTSITRCIISLQYYVIKTCSKTHYRACQPASCNIVDWWCIIIDAKRASHGMNNFWHLLNKLQAADILITFFKPKDTIFLA